MVDPDVPFVALRTCPHLMSCLVPADSNCFCFALTALPLLIPSSTCPTPLPNLRPFRALLNVLPMFPRGNQKAEVQDCGGHTVMLFGKWCRNLLHPQTTM
ncbi:hypothetical protein PAXINDRAFT_14560 [Paxillus involutus ATCC 200175]|uniref:Uncharacterized protein n=1 Tax=Paxillus involutus ATCC 200175 TaxID=664439 RepID=A0A0C9TAK6_PAXIN|nr:hypothetical protein PAXINDRAFT_14560 [Paxillus involutus ATCC 200175]